MKQNRAVKIVVRVVLFLLLCCATAVLLLLYAPPVQRQAARWATGWLQDRLQSTVRLDRFELDFPNRIELQGVFLTDRQGDTLLYGGTVALETNLWQLLNDTLPVRSVTLSDIHLRLVQDDSTWNYQFILDAFDTGKPPSGRPPGIFIAARETPVLLQNVKFEWDNPSGLSYFCLKTDSLSGRLEQVRIDTLLLDFSRMTDRNSRIVWRSGAPPPATQGVFRYDNIDLQDCALQLDRLRITPDSILAALAAFSGRDAGGLDIRKASVDFSLIGQQIFFENLALQANSSMLKGALALDTGDTLRYRVADLNGRLLSSDLTYFTELPYFKKNPADTFALNISGSGSLDELQLQRFDLQSKKSTTALTLRGNLNNLRNPTALGGNVTVERLRTDVRTVQALSPGLKLPENLSPGDQIELQGHAQGDMRRWDLTLAPRYRPARQGRPLTAHLNAAVFNAGQPRLASWKVHVNSLEAPGPLVQDFLPPETLPKDFTLPETTRLSGNVNGNMRHLDGDLHLQTGDPGSTAQLDFSLDDWQGKHPDYHLNITKATLDSALLAPFLRDSMLNQYLHLPPAVQVTGKLDGGTGKLRGDVQMLLPDSAQLDMAYRDSLGHEIVEIRSEHFLPAAFLRPGVLTSWGFDSTQRLDLQAKIELDTQQNLSLQGRAKQIIWSGWQISNMQIAGRQLAKTNTFEGLFLEARFDQQYPVAPVPFKSSGCLYAYFDRIVLPYNDTLDDRQPIVALGDLTLDSLEFVRDTVQVLPDELTARVNFTGQKNSFELNSDWLEGYLDGNFNNRRVPELLAAWLNDHLNKGSAGNAPVPANSDSLELAIKLRQPEMFTGGLIPDLTALDTLEIRGFYHPGLAGAKLTCPEIIWRDYTVRHLEGILSVDSKAATAVVRCPEFMLNAQSKSEIFDVGMRLEDGKAMSRLQLLDSLGNTNLSISAHLEKDSSWQVSFDTTQILQYRSWSVSANNRFVFPENGPMSVHDFEMQRDSQLVRLDGDLEDHIKAEFQALDLSLIPELMHINATALEGRLEGVVRIDSLQSNNPSIHTKLKFNGLKTYGKEVGDINFEVRQTGLDTFRVIAQVSGANDIALSGGFSTKHSLNLTTDIRRLQLETAEPFLNEYLAECKGDLSGTISIKGTLKAPDVNTRLQLKEVTIRPVANNVLYTLNSQSVRIGHNKVLFDSLQLNDERKRHAWLSGSVDLNRPDSIDLDLRFIANDFLLLKTKETDTIPFFGTFMADASGTVKGSIYEPVIVANLKPSESSEVYYKYDSGQRDLVEGVGIVTFVNPDAKDEIVEKTGEKPTYPFRLDLNLELPDNLAVEDMMNLNVILNPLTRDILEAKGIGTLNLDVFPNGDINLNGRLEVSKGSAEYSYNNFFKRKFALAPGGTLTWTKDPYNPLLDLSAHYVVKTSPLPLLAGQSGTTDTTGTNKQTFWLTASLRGYMDDVELKFQLEYPVDSEEGVNYGNSGDPDITQAINQVNSSPNNLSQQVFSLLVFNTFSGGGFDQARVIDWQSGLNNLIAQQLNSLTSGISWIDIDFDLDDNSASGQTDLDIKLKKSFFNNRITFKATGETNINYSGSDRNLSGQFDDVSVEYKINRSGTLKATVYSEQSYNDLFLRNVNETGAGLIFEKEFVRVSEIFKGSNKPSSASKPAQ